MYVKKYTTLTPLKFYLNGQGKSDEREKGKQKGIQM